MNGLSLTASLTLFVWYVGLSVFVLAAIELYKHVRSSRSHAFLEALSDFAGPFTELLLTPKGAADFTIRGPFQFVRLRPQGRMQPLKRESLIRALERTQTPWYRLTLRALEVEKDLQKKGGYRTSRSFAAFLEQLERGTEEMPGKYDAVDIKRFLEARGVRVEDRTAESLQPEILIDELRSTYAPQIIKVRDNYDQMIRNFEDIYRRRTIRQTFVCAFVLAIWFDFSVDAMYARSVRANTAETASAAVAIEPISFLPAATVVNVVRESALVVSETVTRKRGLLAGTTDATKEFAALLHLLIGCAVTAVFVSAGAPLWWRVTEPPAGALLSADRGLNLSKEA